MMTFDFGPDVSRQIGAYGSDFRIARLVHTPGIHVGCAYLGPGGRIAHHAATTPQILAVVEGEGWVRGEGPERTPIRAGQAVFWGRGERHETGTDTGLRAIIVEADILGDGPATMGPPQGLSAAAE